MIQSANGIVVVDSTRRGKRIPDALSKTVPIWCAVLNIVLFGQKDPLIYLPPHIVSASEKSQIEKRIPDFVDKFYAAGIDTDNIIKNKIKKPLRPIWVTPDAFNVQTVNEVDWKNMEEFHPIVLCTASVMAQDNTDFRPGYTYVQGAADDHEEWAALLSPDLLWDNIEILGDLETSDEQLQLKIEMLYAESKKMVAESSGTINHYLSHIAPSHYWIGKTSDVFSSKDALEQIESRFDVLVNLSETQSFTTSDSITLISHPLPEGKKGSKQLRVVLPKLMETLAKHVESRMLIICDTGSDFSVGLCLALLCLYPPNGLSKARDKITIRQRLVMIMTNHKANPSRTTLNAINSFLMS